MTKRNQSKEFKKTENEGFKKAEKWAVIGVVGNLLLTVLKFYAGIVGRSSAMVADAIHSGSDILASLFVYVGLLVSKKPADDEHPYGHYKAEVITTLIVGVMLWLAGIEIVKTAIKTIQSGEISSPHYIALIAAVISILVKEIMYRLTYRVGLEINSPSTIANALDHRSDAFSSIATFIGIGGALLGFPILDPIAGMVVSLFIFRMGYEIIIEAVKQIMDENVDQEKLAKVKEITHSVCGVVDSHEIRMRRNGSVFMVDMDIVVDNKITIEQAHDICEIVRKKLFECNERIEEVRVHIDPVRNK